MALETATYIDGLVATNPAASDAIATADDHMRLIKATIKATFPNINGPVTVTPTQINDVVNKAPLASPALTGTPTAPTAAAGTNTTQVATTAFVGTAVTNATGSLGTMSTQNASSVAITGGTAVLTSAQAESLGVGTAASGTTGEIRATNNITAYYSSDIRFKENVQPIEDALGKVKAIGGKTFQWSEDYIKSHGGEDGYFVQKNDFGVVAQDVQEVFPLAVRSRPDSTLAVDYEKLCALAFEAIKELSAKVEALENK